MIYKTISNFFESFIRREVATEEHKAIFEDKIIEVVTYFKLLYINSGQGAFYNILSSYISDEAGLHDLLKKSYEKHNQGRLIDEESSNGLIIKSIFSNNFLKKFDKEAKVAIPPIIAIFFSGFYTDDDPNKNWMLIARNEIIDVPVSNYADLLKISKDKELEEVGLELCEDLIAIREKEQYANNDELREAYVLLADGYNKFGKTKKEIANLEKVIEINERLNDIASEQMITVCNRIGEIYQEQGKLVTCIDYFEKALKSIIALYGFKHIEAGKQNSLIATVLLLYGDTQKACKVLTMVASNYEINLGLENAQTIMVYMSITDLQLELLDFKSAYRFYSKIYDSLIAYSGEDSELAINMKSKLSYCCMEIGKYDEMEKLQRECMLTIANFFNDSHHIKAFIKKLNADLKRQQREYAQALDLYEYALDLYIVTVTDDDERTKSILSDVGAMHEKLGQYEQALNSYEREYVLRKSETKDENIKIVNLREKIGNVFRLQANFPNALNYLNEALKYKTEWYDEDHKEMLSLFFNLGKLYKDTANYVDSANYLEKALKIADHYLEPLDSQLIDIYWTLAILSGIDEKMDKAYFYYNETIVKLSELGFNLEIAKIYKELAELYLSREAYDDAIECAQKSKLTTELAVGAEDILNLDCVNLLAHVYNESGNCEKAILEYQDVCRIVIEKFGKLDHNLAIAYENMSGVFVKIEKLDYAIEFLEYALAINMRLFGENSAEVANNYSNIAFIEYLQKKHNEALMHYEKVLQINEITNRVDAALTAEIFYALGRLYSSLDDYPKALKYYSRSMKLQEKVVNDLEVVIEENFLIEQCYKFEEEKKYKECVALFSQYLNERVKKQGVNSIGKGVIYQRISECYKKIPKTDEMLQIIYLNKSLAVKSKIYGENNPIMVNDFIEFAIVNREKGSRETALEYFQKAIAIFDIMENQSENAFQIAEIKLNIGMLLREREKFSEAIKNISDAHSYFEEIKTDLMLIWKSVTELGNTYLEADETEAALEYFLKSAEICEAEDFKFKGCIAITYYNLGDTYRILNKKRDAAVNYEKALAIEKELNGNKTFLVGALETNIGLIYKSAGQMKRANEYFLRAQAAYKASRGEDDNNYKYINILLEEISLQILFEEEKEATGVNKLLNVIKGY